MLKKTLFLVALFVLLLIIGPNAYAAQGDVSISPSSIRTPGNLTFQVDILVDSGSLPLGAYDFSLTYNPSKVVIQSIQGGSTTEFSSAPASDPSTYSSGATSLNGINTTSLVSPVGSSNVAKITFKTLWSTGVTPIDISISSLKDTDGFDITPQTPHGANLEIIQAISSGADKNTLVILAILSIFTGFILIGSVRTLGKKKTLVISLILIFLASFGLNSYAPAYSYSADVNADTLEDVNDARHIQAFCAGSSYLYRDGLADVDQNMKIDVADAMFLGQQTLGLRASNSYRLWNQLMTKNLPVLGSINISGALGTCPSLNQLQAKNSRTRNTVNVASNADGSFDLNLPGQRGDSVSIYALDGVGKPGIPTFYKCPPATLSAPDPIITSPTDHSTQGTGRILIEAENAFYDEYLESVKFEYYDSHTGTWNLIGNASIYEDDSFTRNDKFRVVWNTSVFTEASYTVRVQMTNPQGTESDSISVNIETSPTPDISADFDSFPNAVFLSASGSTDDDGIASYSWDLDNDGIYEHAGQSVLFSPVIFLDPLGVSLSVTDMSGAVAYEDAFVKIDEKIIKKTPHHLFNGISSVFDELKKVWDDKFQLWKNSPYGSDQYKRLLEALDLILEARVLLTSAMSLLCKTPIDLGAVESKLKEAQNKIQQAIEKLKAAKAAGANGSKIDDNIEALHKSWIRISWLLGMIKWIEWLGEDDDYVKSFPLPEVGDRKNGSKAPFNKPIDIQEDCDDYDVDVHLHEMDHAWLNHKMGEQLGPGGSHGNGENQDQSFALSEGWAQFSSCAKRGSPTFKDQIDSKYEQDLETNRQWDLDADGNRVKDASGNENPPKDLPKGSRAEDGVSATFWDLNDTNDDGDDTVSIPMKTLFYAFNQKLAPDNHHPKTMEEYYEALTKLTNGTPTNEAIKKVFAKNGIDIP